MHVFTRFGIFSILYINKENDQVGYVCCSCKTELLKTSVKMPHLTNPPLDSINTVVLQMYSWTQEPVTVLRACLYVRESPVRSIRLQPSCSQGDYYFSKTVSLSMNKKHSQLVRGNIRVKWSPLVPKPLNNSQAPVSELTLTASTMVPPLQSVQLISGSKTVQCVPEQTFMLLWSLRAYFIAQLIKTTQH